MGTKSETIDIRQAVSEIRSAIQRTRYAMMQRVNGQALALYYSVGGYLSHRAAEAHWGDKVLETISAQLQQEMPGLRGFSAMSMKKMCRFFKEWSCLFGALETTQTKKDTAYDSLTPACQKQSHNTSTFVADNGQLKIGSLATTQLDKATLAAFSAVQFSHHYEILLKTYGLDERLFYIRRCAAEFWSVEKLRYNLGERLYEREGDLSNNFAATVPGEEQRQKVARAFRRNYKLEFIDIEDPDDWDEHRVETEIVSHIKTFIMTLGNDFSFMGNQYRLMVEGQEYFIDLLFYNRRLRSLVAIELKWGEFRPEYAGKMSFYLSALDDTLRLPGENPSVGIVLCRDQKRKIVEYALRDTRKPMGVATYRAANELPGNYRETLGELDGLKELI